MELKVKLDVCTDAKRLVNLNHFFTAKQLNSSGISNLHNKTIKVHMWLWSVNVVPFYTIRCFEEISTCATCVCKNSFNVF